jgi:hypothetical protein
MNTILIILAIGLMIAAVVALVRGIIAFLRTTEEDLKRTDDGPSPNQIKQNKMMAQRIMFQGAAVLVLALLLLMARG